jgi:mRNA-degrading endonuclease toxin of MazEF toxin-antitoxin module
VSTNDWNRAMSDVVAVPLDDEDVVGGVPSASEVDVHGESVVAVAGALQSISTEHELGPFVAMAAAEDVQDVERQIAELLQLRSLCGPAPRALPVIGHPDRYPRWSEIHFGPRRGDPPETKRYVVVSDNVWNATMPRVLCVRTTCSPRCGGAGFPEIQGGRAEACCGNITSLRTGALSLRGRASPPSVGLLDMVTIARDIAEILELTPTQR